MADHTPDDLWALAQGESAAEFERRLGEYFNHHFAIGTEGLQTTLGLARGEVAELREQLKSAHASGILKAAKMLRAESEFYADDPHLISMAENLESLASKHPQPTAGQEVEDAGTLRINTHEETSDERIRELRETPMTLECFATLERVLSERHALLVDAANRAIASERAAGKGGNDETR